MLSGDNGILRKTTDAKTFTERASVVEQARTDVLGYQAENKGTDLQKSQLQSVLETYFKSVPNLTDMSDTEILNTKLETLAKYGTHNIQVKEIFNGTFFSEETKENKKSVAELREGDQVIYIDGDGNTIPCIVLYDNTGSYGVQIITSNIISKLTLGKNDASPMAEGTDGSLDRTVWSYNNSIDTLNNLTETYRLENNANIADSARCIGSLPSNPSSKNTAKYNMDGMTVINARLSPDYEDAFEKGDSNYTTDKEQMDSLGITKSNDEYWLASRNTNSSTSQYEDMEFINIQSINSSGTLKTQTIVNVSSVYGEMHNSITLGVRPVFSLKTSVHYIEENGIKKIVE